MENLVEAQHIKAIEEIPTCFTSRRDRIVWRSIKDEEYSIKTEYHILKNKKEVRNVNKASSSHMVKDNV